MKLALFIVVLMLGSFISNAQDAFAVPPSASSTTVNPQIPSPLLVLMVAGETIELDPDVNEVPDVESLDPNWMNSIEFLDAADATLQYGNKGRNGVIIIQFKENYILPPSLKSKVGNGK
ncbi:MAG: hypothetical protein WKF87_11160 [Chryseolinea sp.]